MSPDDRHSIPSHGSIRHHPIWRRAPDTVAGHFGGRRDAFTPLATDFTERPFFEHVQRIARRAPEQIAAIDAGGTLSYGRLVSAAEDLADRLKRETRAGEAVGLLLRHGIAFEVGLLACLAADRPYVALDLASPAQRNADILATAGLALCLRNGSLPENLMSALGTLSVLPVFSETAELQTPGAMSTDKEVAEAKPLQRTPDGSAIILYTSGSTGRPKGIVNSLHAVLERVRHYVNSVGLTPDDVFLPLSSPCTIAGTRECFAALATGARLVAADPEALGLGGLIETIRRERVTVLNGVPALLRSLAAAADPEALASLRVVKIGGDRLMWSDIAVLRAKLPPLTVIQAGYSSTETTATYWTVPDGPIPDHGGVPAGYLHSSVDFAVLDDDGRPVDDGEPGELVIRGRSVALGHWHGGQVIPGPIETDPLHPDLRIFRTGDLVTIDKDGLVAVLGRKDRQVKINGKRIEPAELELVLRRAPGVADAAVVVERTAEPPALIAFVVTGTDRVDAGALAMTLRATIRATLPAALTPARLHIVEPIPRLPSGKQDNDRLLVLDRTLREAEAAALQAVPDRFDTEENPDAVIAQAWRRALGTAGNDRLRRWDEAGGDSLGLIRFAFDLETALGRPLPLSLFRMDMRLEDCVTRIAETAEARDTTSENADRPVVYLFPGLMGEGPSLVAFRGDLADVVRLVPIDYPDWRAMALGRDRIADLAEDAATFIERDMPTGPLRIAGYSLGGTVAFETAHLLAARGREIAFLAILDNNIAPSVSSRCVTSRRFGTRIVRVLRDPGHERETIISKCAEALARHVSTPRLRPLLRNIAKRSGHVVPSGVRFLLRGKLWEALQIRAFAAWRATADKRPLAIGATLFVSEEPRPGVPDDLGWSGLVSPLRIIHVSGDHRGMIRDPNRPALCLMVRDALARNGVEASGPDVAAVHRP